MKKAISIKYGGDLVDATEANESSYFELGLVCPCCHKSVHWIKSQERNSKSGKPFTVEPFFSHYRAVSLEEAAACSERVKSIKNSDAQKITEKAKRQRQRLFQAWFWDVVEKHVTTAGGYSSKPSYRKTLLVGAEVDPEDGVEYLYRPLGNMLPVVTNFAKNINVVKIGAAMSFALFGEFGDGSQEDYKILQDGDAEITKVFATIGNLVRQPLHQKVVLESLDFLASKQNLHFVRALFMHFLLFLGDDLDIEVEWLNEDVQRTATLFYRLVGFTIAVVPWGHEFSQIQGQTELPEVSRAFTGVASTHLLDLLRQSGKSDTQGKASLWEVFSLNLFPEDSPVAQGDFSPLPDEHEHRLNMAMQFDSIQTLKSSSAKTKKAIGFGNPKPRK